MQEFYLNWELTLLSRAIAYKNLTAATENIGLSQPQLSRVVAKLEENFGLRLLDRDARRKSGWTENAKKLAELYGKSLRNFQKEIQTIAEDSAPKHLRIGTLEGLSELATEFCSKAAAKFDLHTTELHVYDISDLEKEFSRGNLDVIFSFRQPGKKKFRHTKTIGFQKMETFNAKSKFKVLSPFEFALDNEREKKQVFVSNSLNVRELLIKHYKAAGSLPSKIITKGAVKKPVEILLIAHDEMPSKFWQELST